MPTGPTVRKARSVSPSPRPSKRQRLPWAFIVESLALANGVETDEHRIAQRQKQIDYGKNTLAYDKFSSVWPREKRLRGHPMTPVAKQKCSKRSFAGQVTSWKKRFYAFVVEMEQEEKRKKGEMVEAEKKGRGEDRCAEEEACVGKVGVEGMEVCGREPENTEVSGEDDGVLSDMEDIELDDFGNVVAQSDVTPASSEHDTDECTKDKLDDSSPSIFDLY